MSNEEILKAAISKAVKNGYKGPISKNLNNKELRMIEYEDNGDISLFFGTDTAFPEIFNAYKIIFSHDFAKAFISQELTRQRKEIIDSIEAILHAPSDDSLTVYMIGNDWEKLKCELEQNNH